MNDILVYLILFSIELILCFLYKKYRFKVLLILSFIFPVLFIGFRYYVGTDYKNYVTIFNDISRVESFSELMNLDWEKGALIMFKVVSLLTKDSRIIFIPSAILTLIPLFYINKRFDYKYLPLSMLIYNLIYLPICLNVMRQGIAMSFILMSFYLLLDKKDIKSIISFIIAFLFHKSCLIVLPFLLIIRFDKTETKLKSTKLVIALSLVTSILILFFGKYIMDALNLTFYNSYFNRINLANIDWFYLIMYVPTILLLIFIKTKDSFINVHRALIISGYIFGIVGTTAKYLNRINVYFTIFEIILIPYLINRIKNKKTKVFITILYVLYVAFYFIYQYYILGRHEIFPYQNWLFPIGM